MSWGPSDELQTTVLEPLIYYIPYRPQDLHELRVAYKNVMALCLNLEIVNVKKNDIEDNIYRTTDLPSLVFSLGQYMRLSVTSGNKTYH